MAVTYKIDASQKIIRTECSGAVSLAEVIAHFRELGEDPACYGKLDVLLDVSGMDTLPQGRQFGAINSAISRIRQKIQFGACAIVATRDALFGMMRMFEVLAGDYFRAVRVFRTFDEAEAWLASPTMEIGTDL
jgi:hypothetical protein